MNKETGYEEEALAEHKQPGSIVTGSRKVIVILLAIFWVMVIVAFHNYVQIWREHTYALTRFLSLPFGYLLFKVILSFFYKPRDIELSKVAEEKKPLPSVSAVMPCYNEDKEAVLTAINSLLSQTYALKELFFVDDGSLDDEGEPDTETYDAVCEFINAHHGYYNNTKLVAHRLAENQGKVHAQVWGFERATSDLIMATDSDGLIAPDGVEELVKVFVSDDKDKVGSVVGYVAAENVSKNFLTTVQDMNYSGAFSVGRAAQSVLNCVVVCSGAISLHRKSIILEHLDEYLNEDALGISVRSGDDRRFTQISRKYGWRTKYQATALCYTHVPEKLRKFVRQRVRWTRSSWLYSIRNFVNRPWKYLHYVLFSFMESYLWLITLIIWLLFSRRIELSLEFWIHAMIYYVLMNYLNTVYYIFHKPVRYLLSPIFSLFYGIMLIWIYIKTVLMLFSDKWGTR